MCTTSITTSIKKLLQSYLIQSSVISQLRICSNVSSCGAYSHTVSRSMHSHCLKSTYAQNLSQFSKYFLLANKFIDNCLRIIVDNIHVNHNPITKETVDAATGSPKTYILKMPAIDINNNTNITSAAIFTQRAKLLQIIYTVYSDVQVLMMSSKISACSQYNTPSYRC